MFSEDSDDKGGDGLLVNAPSQLARLLTPLPHGSLATSTVEVASRTPGLGRPRTSQRLYRVMIHMEQCERPLQREGSLGAMSTPDHCCCTATLLVPEDFLATIPQQHGQRDMGLARDGDLGWSLRQSTTSRLQNLLGVTDAV